MTNHRSPTTSNIGGINVSDNKESNVPAAPTIVKKLRNKLCKSKAPDKSPEPAAPSSVVVRFPVKYRRKITVLISVANMFCGKSYTFKSFIAEFYPAMEEAFLKKYPEVRDKLKAIEELTASEK